MRRRLAIANLVAVLVGIGALLAPVALAAASSAPLTAVGNPDGSRTLAWSLQGSSDRINVLPNLRCDLGPAMASSYLDPTDPCLWLADELSPLPALTPAGCLAANKPNVGGPASFASWRCDMREFRDVVIDAAQNAGDRSFVMFNTPATGGSGRCATIPITVRLGAGEGELQADDGCVQTIVCAGFRGTVKHDAQDVVSGCSTPASGGGSAPDGARGGGSSTPVSSGSGEGASATSTSSGVSTAKKTSSTTGKQCPGASSGTKGNSPLYSVLVRAQGKRGMKIYVHLRRAVPITVDVRMRRGNGRTPKIVRWVSRCGKKGTNVITFPNATGGAQNRRNYRVYVKSPNSTYPLRSSWEALPRR